MIKVIPDKSWSAFENLETASIVKYSSRGLVGEDKREFIKRASHPLLSWVKDNPPQPGEVYIHVINMGSTEKVGPNRNGDGYSENMLSRDYITFEKYARWYYNHKNKDPKKSYGIVKKAIFLPDLGRVDSIVALNATEQAARRNGGLVDRKTLHNLESGKLIAVSQSCNVPYDVCVSCGNVARSRAEYCGPEMCKYGGCKDNLGKVFDDGFHLYVDNPKCTFFDLSDVSDTRGADRTAFITGKVAFDRFYSGAELAEILNLTAPTYLLSSDVLEMLSCAKDLQKRACSCKSVPITPPASWDDCQNVRKKIIVIQFSNRPGTLAELPDFQQLHKNPLRDSLVHDLLSELGGAGVILPPSRWLSLLTGVSPQVCGDLFADGLDLERDLLNKPNRDEILQEAPIPASHKEQKWLWLAPSDKAHRMENSKGTLQNNNSKTKIIHVKLSSSQKSLAEQLKPRYLAYQLRILAHHKNDPKFYDVLLNECVRHNLGLTV